MPMQPGANNPNAERHTCLPPRALFVKRCLDLVGATVALALALPVAAACGLWVWAVDGRPILYSQWRVGHNGRLFRLLKLRTMRLDAERDGACFAQADDARILPGCGWMRKAHVDELPQLLNVLLGQMSLVGPRPERPEMIERLRADLPNIEKRLAVPPGLTGLAQVRNGYTNDLPGARRKLAYDLWYLRRQSVRQDLRLLVQTVPKVWDQLAL
jgi:lipopolysaccharide/colanic/teichoic acid biosynthesis glycosyltransferase